MKISCYLVSNGEFKTVVMEDKMLLDLAISLREKGKEFVHFKDGSIEVEGIYIPSIGTKNTIMVLPMEERDYDDKLE